MSDLVGDSQRYIFSWRGSIIVYLLHVQMVEDNLHYMIDIRSKLILKTSVTLCMVRPSVREDKPRALASELSPVYRPAITFQSKSLRFF